MLKQRQKAAMYAGARGSSPYKKPMSNTGGAFAANASTMSTTPSKKYGGGFVGTGVSPVKKRGSVAVGG